MLLLGRKCTSFLVLITPTYEICLGSLDGVPVREFFAENLEVTFQVGVGDVVWLMLVFWFFF